MSWPLFGGELVRYTGVSAAGLAVDAGLLIVLTEVAGVPYLASAAVGFIAGAALVYALSIGWVFAHRSLGDRPSLEFALFVGIGAAGLAINQAVLFAGVEIAGLHYMAAKAAAVCLCFSWNFGARKGLLFRSVRPVGPVRPA